MQVNFSSVIGMTELQSVGSQSLETTSQKKNLFQEILTEVNGQQHQADAKVQQLLLGKADVHDAVLALEKANLSLRLLVQVRNKLVQAYEELSRMPL